MMKEDAKVQNNQRRKQEFEEKQLERTRKKEENKERKRDRTDDEENLDPRIQTEGSRSSSSNQVPEERLNQPQTESTTNEPQVSTRQVPRLAMYTRAITIAVVMTWVGGSASHRPPHSNKTN